MSVRGSDAAPAAGDRGGVAKDCQGIAKAIAKRLPSDCQAIAKEVF
jgi:hypothetical protein